MKKINLVFLVLVVACTKTEVKPSVAETNGNLLAGAKGSSKTWQILSATGSVSGGAQQAINLSDCFKDNLMKFSNDDSQSLEHTEGSTKCSRTDSVLVEKGSWAFTADGKKLIFDVVPYSGQYIFFLGFGSAVNVTEVTDSSLKLSFNVVDGSVTYNYNFDFAKK